MASQWWWRIGVLSASCLILKFLPFRIYSALFIGYGTVILITKIENVWMRFYTNTSQSLKRLIVQSKQSSKHQITPAFKSKLVPRRYPIAAQSHIPVLQSKPSKKIVPVARVNPLSQSSVISKQCSPLTTLESSQNSEKSSTEITGSKTKDRNNQTESFVKFEDLNVVFQKLIQKLSDLEIKLSRQEKTETDLHHLQKELSQMSEDQKWNNFKIDALEVSLSAKETEVEIYEQEIQDYSIKTQEIEEYYQKIIKDFEGKQDSHEKFLKESISKLFCLNDTIQSMIEGKLPKIDQLYLQFPGFSQSTNAVAELDGNVAEQLKELHDAIFNLHQGITECAISQMAYQISCKK